MRSKAELRVVPAIPLPRAPEDLLKVIVPDLLEAERVVSALRRHMVEQGRLVAKERGVGFLREEQLRREFGESHSQRR